MPQPKGFDINSECGAAGTCTGTCNGKGACISGQVGQQCEARKCTDLSHGLGPATCSGAGSKCPAAIPFDCGRYVCEPAFGLCRETCRDSSDCAAGNVCDTGSSKCQPADAGGGGDSGCAMGLRTGSPVALLGLLVAGVLRRLRRR
jgi:hypothetical protein